MRFWTNRAGRDSAIKPIIFFLSFTCATAVLLAQEPTFRSQSNEVLVPVLVRDSTGHAVYGLQTKDFIVEDNGVAQTVRLDEEAKPEPLSIVVAIVTGDMKQRDFAEIHSLNSMLGPILNEPGTQIAVVESGRLAQDFTNDDTKIQRALDELEGGNGAILDTVEYAVNLLDRGPKESKRVLLLISGIRDHGSHLAKIDDVVRLIGSSNTTVYALVFSAALSQFLDTDRGKDPNDWGNSLDLGALQYSIWQAMRRNAPKAIAAQTGGEYAFFESRKRFQTHMLDFTNHLHSRYVLSFQPKNPEPGLHRISVRLLDSEGNAVLARQTYWAAGSGGDDSRSRFEGTWQSRINLVTGKPSITVRISVTEGIAGGSVVLVDPDGSEITSPILSPLLNGGILTFDTTFGDGKTFSWHLALGKDRNEGKLHGSVGEMTIQEVIFKQ